jgi:RNA methyltransferase, TrmH family
MDTALPSQTVLRKLGMKKFRELEGLYLVEGAAALRDAISTDKLPVLVLHDDRALDRAADADLLAMIEEKGLPSRLITEAELVKISGLKTAPPIAGVYRMPKDLIPSALSPGSVVVAFDRVMDPGNLGTLIRSAVFYGVEELWMGEGTVDPFNPKVVRACMGAHLHTRLCRNVNLEQMVPQAVADGVRVIATDMDAEDGIVPVNPEGSPAVLLLGNEPAGLSPGLVTLATEHVAIQRRGFVESLNVAMAGSILLDRLLAR